MNKQIYFNPKNYTGDHLHVGNWKDESKPLIEGIAWVRRDGSMDLFFDDFDTDSEIQEFFFNQGYFYEKFRGGYIGTIKEDEEAYDIFQKWVDEVLYSYRTIDNTSSEEVIVSSSCFKESVELNELATLIIKALEEKKYMIHYGV